MTERATLEALLARVLEGTGPDEKIDGQLALLKGYTYEKRKGDKFPWWRRPDGLRIAFYGNENRPPPYTASLNDALTLVPEGWHAEIGTRPDWPWARLFKDAPLRVTDIVSGPTPPRALIAACLKAMMEAQPSSNP
jgi:hypothetical protein